MKYFSTLLLSIFSHMLLADKIVLATHNLSPYGSYPQQGLIKKIASNDFSGIAVDRIKCAFLKMNQPLQVLVVPWARAQYLAEKEAVDGFFAALKIMFEIAMQIKVM